MNRKEMFAKLDDQDVSFDVLVIGGGATGVGIALDAATRGFRTALLEMGDFAQATSSRATKLVHGGVRYLATGQIHLVREALHERAVMMRNAPHLVQPLPTILPVYSRLQLPYYGAGLLLYDRLSGKSTMGPTRVLGAKATAARVPGIAQTKLRGSVLYHDGQFNDARLALAIARSAADHGAVVLNYARCTEITHGGGRVTGAVIRDMETGEERTVRAKLLINATGIFVDEVKRLDDPASAQLLSVSRGTHIVVAAEVLGGNHALMIPKTSDGRVVFAIPWQGRVVVGTTDIPADRVLMEPGHQADEIDYLLHHVNPYLARTLTRMDILSVFSGLRPLVTGKGASTSKLSREHHIEVSRTGLITVAGGKWTTYRRMAEDTLDFAARQKLLVKRPCVTATTKLHGAPPERMTGDPYRDEYGTDTAQLAELEQAEPALARRIDEHLPYTFAEVVFGVRHEMARTVEDVLSRRTRSLLLDSRATLRAAPAVAALLAKELGHDGAWVEREMESFTKLCRTDYSV